MDLESAQADSEQTKGASDQQSRLDEEEYKSKFLKTLNKNVADTVGDESEILDRMTQVLPQTRNNSVGKGAKRFSMIMTPKDHAQLLNTLGSSNRNIKKKSQDLGEIKQDLILEEVTEDNDFERFRSQQNKTKTDRQSSSIRE